MEKSFWQAIINADCAVPEGHTAADLANTLLGFLGSTDPELRDDFAYGITVRWINREILTPGDLRPWIDPLAANLAQGVGEQETDSVFLRSFSVLMLAALVYYDNHKQPFLGESEVRDLLDKTITYFAAERDLRGYVPDKGWAHSVAHTADLLDEFAISRHARIEDLQAILAAFSEKVMAQTGTILLYNEDDRMTYAVLSALKREVLPHDWVVGWLHGLGGLRDHFDRAAQFRDPTTHSAYLNTKNFLRSLYVRLLDSDLSDSVRDLAGETRTALLNLR